MHFSKINKTPCIFERQRRDISQKTLVKTFYRNQAGILKRKISKNGQNPGGLSLFKFKKSEKGVFPR